MLPLGFDIGSGIRLMMIHPQTDPQFLNLETTILPLAVGRQRRL